MRNPVTQSGSPLDAADVQAFYDSDVVIDTFNEGFAGRWHTALSACRLAGVADGTDYVCHLLGIDRTHEVLDFGSGVGPTTCDVAARTGCRIRGVNIAPRQVAMARAHSRSLDLDAHVAFDLYPGGRLPYETGVFDRVVFFESVCHVPDKALLFSELHRVLKPGGRIGGQDWFLLDEAIAPDNFERYVRPIEVTCAVSLLSRRGYGELLLGAGFREVDSAAATDVFATLGMPKHYEADRPVEASAGEDFATRLRKGNAAIGQAHERGLFTVGFVWGTRPAAT